MGELLIAVAKALEHQRLHRMLVSTQEMNRLQYELLLHMSHEFKSSLETFESESRRMRQIVTDILELPSHSAGRFPSKPMDWDIVLNRLTHRGQEPSCGRILVVDDDAGIVELLTYMLGKEGYQVDAVYDGQAAIDQLLIRRPDFMILDLMMPKLNGFEVLEAIMKTPSLQDLPIIILTARYLSKEEKDALQKRVQGIVQKGQADIHDILQILKERAVAFRALSTAS